MHQRIWIRRYSNNPTSNVERNKMRYFILISSLFISTALEARAGRGRSIGRTSPPTSSYSRPKITPPPARNTPPPTYAPPVYTKPKTSSGISPVTAGVVGVGAGYMIVKTITANALATDLDQSDCSLGYQRERNQCARTWE